MKIFFNFSEPTCPLTVTIPPQPRQIVSSIKASLQLPNTSAAIDAWAPSSSTAVAMWQPEYCPAVLEKPKAKNASSTALTQWIPESCPAGYDIPKFTEDSKKDELLNVTPSPENPIPEKDIIREVALNVSKLLDEYRSSNPCSREQRKREFRYELEDLQHASVKGYQQGLADFFRFFYAQYNFSPLQVHLAVFGPGEFNAQDMANMFKRMGVPEEYPKGPSKEDELATFSHWNYFRKTGEISLHKRDEIITEIFEKYKDSHWLSETSIERMIADKQKPFTFLTGKWGSGWSAKTIEFASINDFRLLRLLFNKKHLPREDFNHDPTLQDLKNFNAAGFVIFLPPEFVLSTLSHAKKFLGER